MIKRKIKERGMEGYRVGMLLGTLISGYPPTITSAYPSPSSLSHPQTPFLFSLIVCFFFGDACTAGRRWEGYLPSPGPRLCLKNNPFLEEPPSSVGGLSAICFDVIVSVSSLATPCSPSPPPPISYSYLLSSFGAS